MKFNRPCSIDFDLTTGLSSNAVSKKRYLSDLKNMYQDEEARLKIESRLTYEYYDLGLPEEAGELSFGTSILYPGKVGNEYHMTKGHFHQHIDTPEVYYGLSGEGYMLMENMEGDVCWEKITPGNAVYVAKGYAHRMINTGNDPLVVFYTYEANAGHDYQTILDKGFRKICLDDNGPVFIDNPKWKE